MLDENWLERLFRAIDDKHTERFCSFLSDDCRFRFGNLDPVEGAGTIGKFVEAFFESITALRHEPAGIWQVPDGIVCHGTVHYTRLDGSILSVPFCNVFRLEDERILEYLVFVDASALYAA